MLVCSDVMSRGVDLDAVGAVISYDPPQSSKAYVHRFVCPLLIIYVRLIDHARVGRTARAGASGSAYTILTPDVV